MQSKAEIAQRLILAGFDPAQVLAQVGLPAIAHTGLPSSQLQQISTVAPQDPKSAYEVKSDPNVASPIAHIYPPTVNMPAPVVNVEPPVVNVAAPIVRVAAPIVNIPEQRTTTRSVERDADGRIVSITEKVDD